MGVRSVADPVSEPFINEIEPKHNNHSQPSRHNPNEIPCQDKDYINHNKSITYKRRNPTLTAKIEVQPKPRLGGQTPPKFFDNPTTGRHS